MTNNKKKKSEAIVYCGPTIPSVVRRCTSFIGGVIPAELQARIDQCSAFGELIVPVNRFAETNRQLRDPYSPMSAFYKKAEEFIKNRGDE